MTINEIAKMAGVSRATVSRYLNDGYVSEEKREKIRAVIEQTGYEPSAQARQLRSNCTRLIGVILPKINSVSVSRMVAGISQVLAAQDYQILLGNTDNDPAKELKFFSVFQANRVDGIILIGTVITEEHKRFIRESGIPVVVMGQCVKECSCVYHDDYGVAKALTAVLLRHAKHPGMIGVFEKDVATGVQRKKGFADALQDAGYTFDEENDREIAEFSMQSGYEHMRALLQKKPDIDAVFCATDSIAFGAMAYLHEQGRKIPEEICLTGIGDNEMGEVAATKLTTAHYYYKTSGEEAANMLLEVIADGGRSRREVKMGFAIKEKDSTLPMP